MLKFPRLDQRVHCLHTQMGDAVQYIGANQRSDQGVTLKKTFIFTLATVVVALLLAMSPAATGMQTQRAQETQQTQRVLAPEIQLSLLMTPELSPPWFPVVTGDSPEVFTPSSRLQICDSASEAGIRLQGAPQAESGAANLLRYPSPETGGYFTLGQVSYLFATRKAATATWSKLVRQSEKCNQKITVPYQFADTGVLGETQLIQRVNRGTAQYGSRSIVIDTNGPSKKFDATQQDRVVGGLIIWRLVGQSLIKTYASKAVNSQATNALSLQEKTTIAALAELASDKFHAASL